MIVSNTVFFQEKNASPENENGWTPSKKKKDGISRNPSWVHLRKSQVKGRPPIVFQVPKSASPAVKFSGMETFLGSEVYSLGKLGYAPAGGLLESIGDYVWKLKTNQIMGGCGDLLGWCFGGCGWFWCFFVANPKIFGSVCLRKNLLDVDEVDHHFLFCCCYFPVYFKPKHSLRSTVHEFTKRINGCVTIFQ